MKQREDLIKIFDDTELLVEKAFDTSLISVKEPFDITPVKPYGCKGTKQGLVTVDNIDCVTVAQTLSYSGKTCILNMASHYSPGGGVRNGARAQEEELCRRSNLIYGLEHNDNDKLYPIKESEYIYTRGVTFFKDSNYMVCEPFELDVLTIPAINRNKEKDKWLFEGPEDTYQLLMENKILQTITKPFDEGCENLVLSAFGCGVFKNDPKYVSSVYRKFLFDYNARRFFKRISFAILNDSNSVGTNFEIFKKELDAQ